MKKPFIEIDAENFTLSAFETNPIESYEVPTNKETGKQFPNCCPFHKSVFEGAESWFLNFPNCCEPHRQFTGKWWFKKENYNCIAEKIVKQLSYTEHHISERIKKPDWYKDITDYIEYNVSSFGHPAVGLHLYLGNLKHYIQNTEGELNKEQRQRLTEFIEGYYKSNETEKTDFNILYSTYQKWLNEFPFELNSYFGNLKQHFEKQLPILNGKPETNIYSGIAKAKMHTKSSLIEALINLTNNLLTQINGVTLYEKGLITDANKIKLELVINSRKLKLEQGYKNSSPNEEQQYRKILKEWFNDEKKFIDEITPLLCNESDLDFIKGNITLKFFSQLGGGFYEVEKSNFKRKFTIEKYFDLDLKNWENLIDKLNSKTEKIQAVKNAIFTFQKDHYNNSDPAILNLINKNLEHLKVIEEYINSNYPENLPPQQHETKTEQETQTENDFTLSTIEDWLFEFKEKMNEADYQNLVSALIKYFETGIFPTLSKPIQINGRPNKKLFGWALNRIFEAKGKGIEKELLQFAKQNISLFTNVKFDETNILKSNLYKYFTTKTK